MPCTESEEGITGNQVACSLLVTLAESLTVTMGKLCPFVGARNLNWITSKASHQPHQGLQGTLVLTTWVTLPHGASGGGCWEWPSDLGYMRPRQLHSGLLGYAAGSAAAAGSLGQKSTRTLRLGREKTGKLQREKPRRGGKHKQATKS